MKEIYTPGMPEVDGAALEAHVRTVAEQFTDARRVLIVPPDFTRCYSMAGEITKLLYGFFVHTVRDQDPDHRFHPFK